MRRKFPTVVIVMGVSGSGKSTVGELLAKKMRAPFYDADDYHSAENIAKLSAGIPLNDADRAPWLDRLHCIIQGHVADGTSAVVSCSALKHSYRERLCKQLDNVMLIYLHGEYELIWQRMQSRQDHFMKAGMLQSQFDTLEQPTIAEAEVISIELTPEQIVTQIIQRFGQ